MSFEGMTLDQVFADLASRFVVNLPADELASIERVCFQVEQGHWFYEDFVRPERPDLPSLALRHFSELFLQKCSAHLSAFAFNPKKAYDAFLKYKTSIPVRGAILMTPDRQQVLLVKGWKSSAGWGFPKGKINKNEDDRDCAIREVWEEIGYDISVAFDPLRQAYQSDTGAPLPLTRPSEMDKDYLEITLQEQSVRLYIIQNVQESAPFRTRTRKEISRIAWFDLHSLPGWSKQAQNSASSGAVCRNADGSRDIISSSKFFLVGPIVKALRRWLTQHPQSALKQTSDEITSFATLSDANQALQSFFMLEPISSIEIGSSLISKPGDEHCGSDKQSRQLQSEPNSRERRRAELLSTLDDLIPQLPSPPSYVTPSQSMPPHLPSHPLNNFQDNMGNNSGMDATPITFSQPTPVRPIPLMRNYNSPQPPVEKVPQKDQQSKTLLGLLNMRPAL